MRRQARLPGAAELFRVTSELATDVADRVADRDLGTQRSTVTPLSAAPSARGRARPSGGTGRVRHDEKITVYISAAELLHLEKSRLALRADHDIVVDRGRIVREAIAQALAEFDDAGAACTLVRRLLAEEPGL
ncbi:MAG: cobyrinic acid a,c-diamide synthase [Corynebacteriales bacterium]|nr:cobyrinic acid a,c-diamide synthase [Mycobacteriales bacterium]